MSVRLVAERNYILIHCNRFRNGSCLRHCLKPLPVTIGLQRQQSIGSPDLTKGAERHLQTIDFSSLRQIVDAGSVRYDCRCRSHAIRGKIVVPKTNPFPPAIFNEETFMSDSITAKHFQDDLVIGHHPGLFLLFFTEMWERFSYYGMRALLVLFLVSEIAGGGWGWTREAALGLYATYTGLVYLTPIFGGIVADKLLGYRLAVLLGALLMTLGHAALAFETEFMFYAGLWLLIFGNGFFKPNISTLVGQLYANDEDKKDAAYTIFYMGINAGAFLGILLCGFIGEQIGWSYGFGLAGIFMFLGMVMFYFGQPVFGGIGTRKAIVRLKDGADDTVDAGAESDVQNATVIKDRLVVVGILSFFTIFFWIAFEQAGGSLTIFAKDYTQRVLTGNAHWMFVVANTFLTLAPLAIVTWVLLKLINATKARIPFSNLSIGISFVLVWLIALFMLYSQFTSKAYEVSFTSAGETPTELVRTIRTSTTYAPGDTMYVVDIERKGGAGTLKVISNQQADDYETKFAASVDREKANETEVPASWFGILNSFFIIALAPLMGKIWSSRWNPSAPVKFGVGLILLGLGFGAVAYASAGLEKGVATASISLWWLVVAYLLHTLGELCVSPVGLSYVSKLAPAKLVGLMFGVWFGATAIANYLAGWSGSYIDKISEHYGLSTFFLIYTAIPIVAGVVLMGMNPMIKRKMHGIE